MEASVQEKRKSQKTLTLAIERAAGCAVTDDYAEAEYVHNAMRFRAGLLKVPPKLYNPEGALATSQTERALRRQADTLYEMMLTGRA